jgi:Domain of unknown function (DUF4386)
VISGRVFRLVRNFFDPASTPACKGDEMPQNISSASQCKPRLAGLLFLFSVAAALSGEFLAHGRLAIVLGLIAVACYAGVTLLIYNIFKPVHPRAALLAVSANFAGLLLEALRWNPRGVDIAMIFHAAYCLLLGYLIFHSGMLPKLFAAPVALAGLLWLTNLFPALANFLSTYTLVPGLLGEALPYLWLLIFGTDHPRRNRQIAAAHSN